MQPLQFRLSWLAGMLLLIVAALPTTSHTPAQDKTTGRKLALLVGVKEYDHAQLNNLQYPENDVEELGEVLKEHGFQVVVLTTKRGRQDEKLLPTTANVKSELAKLVNNATKHDIALVALAGHGIQPLGSDKAYFCPKDANPTIRNGVGKEASAAAFPERLIGLDDILSTLEESGVGQKLLLVDACRNDPGVRGRRGVDRVKVSALPAETGVLLSCSSGQYAFEHKSWGKGGHGAFFSAVLDGLRGAAAERTNVVTWESLGLYVRRQVPTMVEQVYGKDGAEQRPNLIANISAAPATLATVLKSNPTNSTKPDLVSVKPETPAVKPELPPTTADSTTLSFDVLMDQGRGFELIPSDAGIVIRLRNPEALKEKAAVILDSIQPGFGSLVRDKDSIFGKGYEQIRQKGLEVSKDFWLVFFPDKNENKQQIWSIVGIGRFTGETNSETGKKLHFQRNGNWAYFSDDKQAFDRFQKRLKKEVSSIAPLINDSGRKAFDNGDLSIYVNVEPLIAENKAMFEAGRQGIAQAFAGNKQTPPTAGIDSKAMMRSVEDFFGGFVRFAEDSTRVIVSVNLKEDGILLEVLGQVASYSSSDDFLRKVTTARMPELLHLPSDHLAYFGAHFDVREVIKLLGTLVDPTTSTSQQKQHVADLKRRLEELGQLKFGTIVGSANLRPGDAGAMQTFSLVMVDDAVKVRAFSRSIYSLMQNLGMPQAFTVKANAERFGNYSADLLLAVNAAAATPDPILQLLYGPQGAETRTIYFKDRYISTTGGGRLAMTEMLNAQSSVPGRSNRRFMSTREQLSPEANLVLLADLPNLIKNLIVVTARSNEGMQGLAKSVASLSLKESLIGLSVACESRTLRLRVYIPTDQLATGMRLAAAAGINLTALIPTIPEK